MKDEKDQIADRTGREWRGEDMFAPITPNKPYLMSLDVMDNLVRGFLIKIADIRAQQNGDKITHEQAVQAISDLTQEYADILEGKNDEYSFQPWNSVDQLGAYISTLFESVPKEKAIKTYFSHMANVFLRDIIVPVEDDEIVEEAATFRINVLVEDAVKALQGLTNHPDE